MYHKEEVEIWRREKLEDRPLILKRSHPMLGWMRSVDIFWINIARNTLCRRQRG